jgi:hypothetical protein
VFPALCFWLLWGGSVWTPIVAMLGFAVMGGAYLALVGRLGPTSSALIGVFLALLWWLFLDVPLTGVIDGVLPWGLMSVNSDQFGGFLLAITIGVTAITFSLPIGILLAGLLMALTYIGGELASFMLALPSAAIQAFQGMLLFFLLAVDLLTNYRIRFGAKREVA